MSAEEHGGSLEGLSTIALLDKANGGDARARDALYSRYLRRLQRWARGRLPSRARALVDTDDLVQDTLLKTLTHAGTFHPEHSGAFLGYVRRAVENRIVDEIRRAQRRPSADETAGRIADQGLSPLESVILDETQDLYEQAFQRLKLSDQAAITARLEEGLTYEEVARELGKSSADAARMAVTRAVVRLAVEMRSLKARPR